MANHTLLHDPKRGWLRFTHPVAQLTVKEPAEVLPALQEIEQFTQRGQGFAAGWLSYEAASSLNPDCQTQPASDFPLLSFGLYTDVERLDHAPVESPWGHQGSPIQTAALDWQLDTAKADYVASIERIHREIAAGNTYQVNHTVRKQASLAQHAGYNPWALYRSFASKARYSAFIEQEDYLIASASPELFFRLDGHAIKSKPMKGTTHRGQSPQDDHALGQALQRSEKNRAENLMIVDMIRNDLGMIAEAGSVKVDRLFEIEPYPTVWQMTSTVEARTHASLCDILQALYPCASITGAPKINTMRLITELESSPRDIYTGSIGYLGQHADGQRCAMFNVAIRSLQLNKQQQHARYGIGGGIIWDSEAESEYQECLLKSQALNVIPA